MLLLRHSGQRLRQSCWSHGEIVRSDCFWLACCIGKIRWHEGVVEDWGVKRVFKTNRFQHLFFFPLLKGIALEQANTICCSFFLCVCVCVHVHLADRRHKKDSGKVSGKLPSWTCICVCLTGNFSNPQRKVCFLSVLVFQEWGRGVKAIFKWHLQSRSSWTQSAPVRPKWTTGQISWRRKLNANHSKHSHSCTSIRLSHTVWGGKWAKIGQWLEGCKITHTPRGHSAALLQQQMQQTCGYWGSSHGWQPQQHTTGCSFVSPPEKELISHDCWWQFSGMCRPHILLHTTLSSPSSQGFSLLFSESQKSWCQGNSYSGHQDAKCHWQHDDCWKQAESVKPVTMHKVGVIKNNEISMWQP